MIGGISSMICKKFNELNRFKSYHTLMVGQFINTQDQGRGCFKFQNIWLKYHCFMKVVEESWGQQLEGKPTYVFATKLKRLTKVLSYWNRSHFGNLGSNIVSAENALNLHKY